MSAPTPRPSRLRAVASRALLLGGAALAVVTIAPALPREQNVVFVVGRDPPVRKLDVRWTRAGDAEPTGGVTLRFDRGAPRRVRHRFSAPNGEYELEGAVARAAPGANAKPGAETSFARRVRLEGHETVVLLRRE